MGVNRFADISIDRGRGLLPEEAKTYVDLNTRELRQKRSLVLWQVPHLGQNQFIEMYINPQNIQVGSRKEIQRLRTKGGYIAQYWGEDFDSLTLTGTTGDAGIEGINVLRDVYRSELISVRNILRFVDTDPRRQSLMQLAASVTMWYQGEGYRGYFTDMNYTESVNQIGLFDYNMGFQVVEWRGNRRRNFLPWHRHPWSTSQTPNSRGVGSSSSEQDRRGGAFNPGDKVGALNAPPMTISSFRFARDGQTALTQLAVIRGDPRDPTTKGFGNFASSRSGRRATEVNTQIDRALRAAAEAEAQEREAGRQAQTNVGGSS